MRTGISCILVLLISISLSAQTTLKSFVVLKNKDKIQGEIIESIPNTFLILKINDSTKRKVKFDDIKNILELPNETNNYQELIYLQNGDRLRGDIILKSKEKYIINTIYRDSILIHSDSIKKIVIDRRRLKKPKLNFTSDEFQDVMDMKNGDRFHGKLISEKPDKQITFQLENKSLIHAKQDEINIIYNKKDNFYLLKADKNISFAIGAGDSYGGYLGLRFQQRFGDIMGFAYHIGTGAYLDGTKYGGSVGFNAGIKYYMYKWYYADISYGWLKRRITHGAGIDEYGTSFKVGLDFFVTPSIGFNAALGFASGSFNPGFQIDYFAFDFGLVIAIRNKNIK